MKVNTMTEMAMLRAIKTLQEVQMRTPPTAPEWKAASRILNELFAEMNRRDKCGFYRRIYETNVA